jgi:hypothetical protein
MLEKNEHFQRELTSYIARLKMDKSLSLDEQGKPSLE